MSNCGNCEQCGCERCGGCLELTEAEVALLDKLGQYAFLPVARRADDMTPVYRDSEAPSEEYSLLLQLLERKQLVSLDYDCPLKDCREDWYLAYPVKGSCALTGRGQLVLDHIQTQGIQSP